ncbi:hypothetical protein Gohar_008335, partial [Gossypium harknessii]|nr:hypothetical protein [Gossypium harknessii]
MEKNTVSQILCCYLKKVGCQENLKRQGEKSNGMIEMVINLWRSWNLNQG